MLPLRQVLCPSRFVSAALERWVQYSNPAIQDRLSASAPQLMDPGACPRTSVSAWGAGGPNKPMSITLWVDQETPQRFAECHRSDELLRSRALRSGPQTSPENAEVPSRTWGFRGKHSPYSVLLFRSPDTGIFRPRGLAVSVLSVLQQDIHHWTLTDDSN